MRRKIYIFILILISFFALTGNVNAGIRLTVPSFPSCEDPEGTVVAHYDQGLHGIPGDYQDHYGADTVYQLSEDTLTQCLCELNDDGIQTNWWKVTSLSVEEIEYLQKLGWVYVPDGSAWGLDQAPYMAYNLSFDCNPNNDDEDNHDDDDDDDEDDDPRVGGIQSDILATSTVRTDILGLASTGDAKVFMGLIIAGILFTTSGFILLSKKHR